MSEEAIKLIGIIVISNAFIFKLILNTILLSYGSLKRPIDQTSQLVISK